MAEKKISMHENVLKYTKKGFYQNKAELIENSVMKYVDALKNDLPAKKTQKIKSQSEKTLCNIMVENGFRESDNAFIAIEKEFFTDNAFDPEKLENFQKQMVLNYSDQQLKWTFAGTAACYSPITKKHIEESGRNYLDILPVELQRDYKEKKQNQYNTNKKADAHIYLYTDGTTSNNYDANKAKFSFNKTEDKSGFNWKKGYDANNKIKKSNWGAGFNHKNEYEFFTINKETASFKAGNNLSPARFYTESSEQQNSQLGLLSVPGTEEVFLFDNNSELKDSKQDRFYSLSGELYGVQEIDQQSSITNINNYLKKNKVSNLSGIVVANTDKETISFYKESLKKYINKDTVFYAKNEEKLKEKMQTLKTKVEETEVSQNILTGFFSLSKQGRKGEELYEGLVPAVKSKTYNVNLNIFESKDELNTFVNKPEIKNDLDEESINYLASLQVPAAKQIEFSNAVQNIIHNHNDLFKHTNIEKKELLETTYNVVVKNKTPETATKTIATEKNLSAFVKSNQKVSTKTDIPSFNKAFKSNNDYFNLFDEEQFDMWAASTPLSANSTSSDSASVKDQNSHNKDCGVLVGLGLPKESIDEIKQVIQNSNIIPIEREEYCRAMQNTFAEYKAIQSSTGMPAVEVAKAVTDIVKNKNYSTYTSKRIFFEKDLNNLLKEAATGNPNKTTITKDNIYMARPGNLVTKQLDLLNDSDLETFAMSGHIKDAGINEEEQKEIISYLETVSVPAHLGNDFSKGVINTIYNYQSQIASKNVTAIQAVQAVTDYVNNNQSKVLKEIKPIIEKNIGTKIAILSTATSDSSNSQGRELNLTENKDLSVFTASPFMKEQGLTAQEKKSVVEALKNIEIPEEKSEEFTRGIINTLKIFKEDIKPQNISAKDIVIAVANRVNNKKSNLPKEIEHVIASSIDSSNAAIPIVTKINSESNDIKTSEEDLMTFVKSDQMNQAGITNTEQEKIISYLNSVNIATSNRSAFNSGVTNTIKNFKSIIAPLGISALDAVKSNNFAIKKQYNKIPESILPIIKKSIKAVNTKESNTKLNLLNKKDYNTFVKSSEFKNSGINQTQLDALITEHRNAFQGSQNKYYKQVPLTLSNRAANQEEANTAPLVVKNSASTNTENNVYNLAFAHKSQANVSDNVILTPQAQKIVNNEMQQNIINNTTNVHRIIQTSNSQAITENMSYSNPFSSIVSNAAKQAASQRMATGMQQPVNNNLMHSQPQQQQRPNNNMNTEQAKMQRIQQNYENDKRMLAKSVGGAGGSGGTGKGATGGGNNIQKTIDDLFDEFKNTAKRDF